MPVPIILYLGPAEQQPLLAETLGSEFTVKWSPSERADVESFAAQSVAIIDASMKVRFDPDLLGKFARLRVVGSASTGTDHFDQAFLDARNVPIFSLRGQRQVLHNITAAAEHSWLLLMACSRHLREAVHHVEGGGWERTLFPGTMLRGKTLGVIGCGRIGSWMTRYALAFEMKVVGFDPHASEWPEGMQEASLEELLATSDFVSIHVPFNQETGNLLDRSRVESLKSGSVLINTSRGGVVDEGAILDALKSGQLAAYGADVLGDEPGIQASALWQYARTHSNVLITPHIGGFCPEAVTVVVRFTAERVRNFLISGVDK